MTGRRKTRTEDKWERADGEAKEKMRLRRGEDSNADTDAHAPARRRSGPDVKL